MKQVLQNLRDGSTEVAEVPCPHAGPGELLIRTSRSLVSTGTEGMLVEFGKASLLDKARQQPDKVRMVLEKARTDGLVPTLQAVRGKLDVPLTMGYSSAGVVAELGPGVGGFAVGDRVACNGAHAELVSVPANLCAKVPDGVSDDEAAFTVIAAIALQGIRLAQPTLGEAVAVTGLGLVGLVTVQLLRAQGCRVLGIDPDPARLEVAQQLGAQVVQVSTGGDLLAVAEAFSRGRGVDAVIITASTSSSEPVHQAASMCRKRGRIVLVGVTGLELSRADFYEKELTFQVSCSYGPGRYDPTYEAKGRDYPVGFVRWTEQRNFEAVLDMLADSRLQIRPLISHRFPIERAASAYEVLTGAEPRLGILLEYPAEAVVGRIPPQRRLAPLARAPAAGAGKPAISFVGAGNYAVSTLMPAFKAAGARLCTVASRGGTSALHAGRKFGFEAATTDTDGVVSDGVTKAVVIATRHDTHARFVLEALRAGKQVFVEKPLCLSLDELVEITAAWHKAPALLMVGFNRRFAPQVVRVKALLSDLQGPKAFVMTVNAGPLPPEHWTRDLQVGGGRIVGEACHFVDLLRFLAGTPISGYQAAPVGDPGDPGMRGGGASFTLRFADGSLGTVHYLANGHRGFPKERLEVYCGGRILQIDNFRRLDGFGWPGFRRMLLWRQDKGQRACAAAFVDAMRNGGPCPIPAEEIFEVSRVTIEIAESLGSSGTG